MELPQDPQDRVVGWDAAGFPYDAQGRRVVLPSSPPSIGQGVRDICVGVLSLLSLVAFQFLSAWPVWLMMVIVAIAIFAISDGIGKVVQVKHEERSKGNLAQDQSRAPIKPELEDKPQYNRLAMPSVTEHTTRELEGRSGE